MKIGRPVAVEWKHSEAELEGLYRKEKGARRSQRFQALWFLRQGLSMKEVGQRLGKSDRTIQTWLRYYRQGGLEGMMRHLPKGPGYPPKMRPEQIQALKQHLNQGSTKTIEQVYQYVKRTFSIVFNRKYFQQWLSRNRVTWKVPRPSNPQADPALQSAWKKKRAF